MSSAVADASTARTTPALSPREIEVLRTWLIADTKDEAARTLFVSPATVTTHITRIRAKYAALGRLARSKSRLFALALQDGYIRLDDFDD